MTSTTPPKTLDFMGLPVAVIEHNNQMWLTAEQAGQCLGYAAGNARIGINNLYNRHIEEFETIDTCTINLMAQIGVRHQVDDEPSKGGNPNVRIFSATGCTLLGFFANTVRAQVFRRWAKSVLANKTPPVIEPLKTWRGRGRVNITRAMEFSALTQFAQGGVSQADIARSLGISSGTVCDMLHGRFRFSPYAGVDQTTPELAAAVTERHMSNERIRFSHKYCISAANALLANALDGAGQAQLGNARNAVSC